MPDENILTVANVLDDVKKAEEFAKHLPLNAPRTQFILDLCTYCRNNNAYYCHYSYKQNFFKKMQYALFVHHGLSYDKLRLVVRYLEALIARGLICCEFPQTLAD